MSSPHAGAPTLRFALVTVHPDATEETDRVGGFVRQRLQRYGHKLVLYRIIPPKRAMIREGITKMEGRVDTVLFNGSAGIGAAGVAVDALMELVPNELPGFATLLTLCRVGRRGSALPPVRRATWRHALRRRAKRPYGGSPGPGPTPPPRPSRSPAYPPRRMPGHNCGVAIQPHFVHAETRCPVDSIT